MSHCLLTDTDIAALMKSGEIKIEPFEEECLTPVGYDLRVGDHAVSWRKRCDISVKEERQITIDPGDTVLLSVRERIQTSKKIAGTIHSKVSLVSRGFSHVSTTVDPGWKGELTVLISNVRDIPLTLKFEQPFCTLVLHKTFSPATKEAPESRALPTFYQSLLKLEEKLSWRRRTRNVMKKKPITLIGSLLVGYGIVLIPFYLFLSFSKFEMGDATIGAIFGSGMALSLAILALSSR